MSAGASGDSPRPFPVSLGLELSRLAWSLAGQADLDPSVRFPAGLWVSPAGAGVPPPGCARAEGCVGGASRGALFWERASRGAPWRPQGPGLAEDERGRAMFRI